MGVDRVVTKADKGVLDQTLVHHKASVSPVCQGSPPGDETAHRAVKDGKRPPRPKADLLDPGLFPLRNALQRLPQGGRKIKKGLFVLLHQLLIPHGSSPFRPLVPWIVQYMGGRPGL